MRKIAKQKQRGYKPPPLAMPKFEKCSQPEFSPETPVRLITPPRESIEEQAHRIIQEEFEDVRRRNLIECDAASINNNYGRDSVLDKDSPINSEH